MEPANKRVKTEEVGSSNIGGGGSGGGNHNDDGSPPTNPSSNTATNAIPPLKSGGCERPDDLVLVGRIVDTQPCGGVGKGLLVKFKTWVTDLYRIKHWYLEPNVDNVVDVDRGKILAKAVCNGFSSTTPVPSVSELTDVANGSHGHAVMGNVQLLLYNGNSDGSEDGPLSSWDHIVGTPPAWFAQMIDDRSSDKEFAKEFKGALVYVSRAQLLHEQRDWIYE